MSKVTYNPIIESVEYPRAPAFALLLRVSLCVHCNKKCIFLHFRYIYAYIQYM